MTTVKIRSPFRILPCLSCGDFIVRGTSLRTTASEVLSKSDNKLESYRIHVQCQWCKAVIVYSREAGCQRIVGASGLTTEVQTNKVSEDERLRVMVGSMNEEEMKRYANDLRGEELLSEQRAKIEGEEKTVVEDATAQIPTVKSQQEALSGLMDEVIKLMPLTGGEAEELDADIAKAGSERMRGLACILNDGLNGSDGSAVDAEAVCEPANYRRSQKRLRIDSDSYRTLKEQRQ